MPCQECVLTRMNFRGEVHVGEICPIVHHELPCEPTHVPLAFFEILEAEEGSQKIFGFWKFWRRRGGRGGVKQ